MHPHDVAYIYSQSRHIYPLLLRFLPLSSGLVCSLLISEPRPPQAMTKRPFLEPPRLSAETALL